MRHNNRWTYESCEAEARKYKTKKEFREKSYSAYHSAEYHGWMEKFDWLKPLKGFLTREYCLELASMCRTSKEFKEKHGSAYATATRNGWLEGFEFPEKPNTISWTFEKAEAEAKKYAVVKDFRVGSPRAYSASLRHGWMKKFNWLESGNRRAIEKRRKYTRDVCMEHARKCTCSSEFEKLYPNVYEAARRNGWIPDYTWFVRKDKNPYCVYRFLFEETHSVYFGLSRVPKERFRNHRRDKSNAPIKHALKNGIPLPEPEILFKDLSYGDAGDMEKALCDKYASEGWNVLNVAKCGAISSSRGAASWKWTKKRTFDEAKKFTKLVDFVRKSPSAYNSARRNGWFDQYTWLERVKLPNGTWTVEKALETANENKNMSKSEFMHEYYQAYDVLRKSGLLEKIEFKLIRHENNYWTRERCREAASKYTTRKDFEKNNPGAYSVARRNKWLEDYDWMPRTLHSWTKEECMAEMKKYRTKAEFRRSNKAAYSYAQKSGLMREYDGFEDGNAIAREKRRKWTYETLEKEARKYKTRGEFNKGNNSAYNIACRKGYIDKWFPKTFRWTKEKFMEELEKYSSLQELRKKCPRAYSAGMKHGWIEDSNSKRTYVPRGYWTLENALKFGRENRHMTAGEFCRKHNRPYVVLRKNHAVGMVGFRNYKSSECSI